MEEVLNKAMSAPIDPHFLRRLCRSGYTRRPTNSSLQSWAQKFLSLPKFPLDSLEEMWLQMNLKRFSGKLQRMMTTIWCFFERVQSEQLSRLKNALHGGEAKPCTPRIGHVVFQDWTEGGKYGVKGEKVPFSKQLEVYDILFVVQIPNPFLLVTPGQLMCTSTNPMEL
ncbi:uncharacterized protein LOC112514240 [Cynara cardunculus var. scolymus]|uniref:uncharacterized protein LOC112514240 n=1 Tax=Cynara cardunculus var. scolymus TaxID=59895 RepID=UPI000D629EB5|nr:uncharacterized protein LOC112514240 [Cynara cardunculus var. scolymus]